SPAPRDGRLPGADGCHRPAGRRRYLRSGGSLAPRRLAGTARGRSEPARRAQAKGLPHARLAREGAQEGRSEEGAQASTVLQALGEMSGELFGTDGVRGVAGEFVTAELALALGRAATRLAPAERPQVLIVRDTRESGEMLQAAVAAGVSSAGGDA